MEPNAEEYVFICQQWFDKNQGDKKTVRELYPTHNNGYQNGKVNRNEISFTFELDKNLYFILKS